MKRKFLLSMKDDQSGIAYAAAVAFGTLVAIAISWSILGPSLERHVFGYVENQINPASFDYGPTAALIHYVWAAWPIILLIAVILYLFMSAHRRVYSPDVGW